MDGSYNAKYFHNSDAAASLLAGALMNRWTAMQPAIACNRNATAVQQERIRMKSQHIGVATTLALFLVAALAGCSGKAAQVKPEAVHFKPALPQPATEKPDGSEKLEHCKAELTELKVARKKEADERAAAEERRRNAAEKALAVSEEKMKDASVKEGAAIDTMQDVKPSILRARDRKIAGKLAYFVQSHACCCCRTCGSDVIRTYAGHKVLHTGSSAHTGSVTKVVLIYTRTKDPANPKRRAGRHLSVWLLEYDLWGDEDYSAIVSHTADPIDSCID